MAHFFDARAEYKGAEPLMYRALAIDEKSFGPEHPEVATDLNNLAGFLQATDRLGEAEPDNAPRVAAIFEKSFGPDHPNVAGEPQQLGSAAAGYQPAGRGRAADAARTRHRREELRALIIPTSPCTSTTWPRCCRPPTGSGEAEPLMRRVVAISEKVERDTGPDASERRRRSLNNLAQLLHGHQPVSGEAEPLMRRALAIDETSFGPEHPDVAIGLNNLAASAPGHQPSGARPSR